MPLRFPVEIEQVRKFVLWLRGHAQFTVLLALLLIASGIWGFAELADDVTEGDTQDFDNWAVQALRQADDPGQPLGPRWLHELGRDITALGGVGILSFFTLAVAGYLLMVRKYHALWLVIAATVGALVISTTLKYAFDRERPQLVPHLSHVYTSSFPSGHSMLSAAVYLTLGVLLARLVPHRAAKVYFLTVAVILTFLVGISRIYMGVHYPTDVLAGWVAGLVWALICWSVARYLQLRGAVEKDTEETADLPEATAVG